MEKNSIIQHQGTVLSVKEGAVKVQIVTQTACAACHAKSHCMLSDSENKIIDIADDSGQYTAGDQVLVVLEQSKGLKALALGYLIPFGCVIVALVGGMAIFHNEVIAGLVILGVLAVYYWGLYLFRDKIKQSFHMTLKKQ